MYAAYATDLSRALHLFRCLRVRARSRSNEVQVDSSRFSYVVRVKRPTVLPIGRELHCKIVAGRSQTGTYHTVRGSNSSKSGRVPCNLSLATSVGISSRSFALAKTIRARRAR